MGRQNLREETMTDSLDDFINTIQQEIHEETRKAHGKVAFERWLSPRYVGVMDNPHGYGHVAGSCGDRMEIFLRFEEDRVKEATFRTDGCGSSLVCGSFAAELALGKTADEVAAISGETILEALGGLPEEDRHCALLAAETLQTALDDYMRKLTRKKQEKDVPSRAEIPLSLWPCALPAFRAILGSGSHPPQDLHARLCVLPAWADHPQDHYPKGICADRGGAHRA